MKKTIFFLFITSLFLIASDITGQNRIICGTGDLELIDQRKVENDSWLEKNQINFRAPIYVPVKLHLIGDNNGFGRVSEFKVVEQMNQLIKDFSKMGAIFYLKDSSFNYVNSTRIYDSPETVIALDSLNKLKLKFPNCINVFISNKATSPNANSIGQTLGYYSPTYDYLVVRKDNINKTSGTLSHEIGHFFSLPHTFRGWDYVPWDPAIHGVTVTAVSPGGVLNENVNGVNGWNCTSLSSSNVGGDGICDTPPDYNFGYGWTGCSIFTSIANDPRGVRIDPQENNMMGYFLGCALYEFTNGQTNLKLADWNSGRRSYLRISHVPNTKQIVSAPTLVSPINQVIVDTYNDVTLRWDPVLDAGFYVVEVARSSTWDIDYQVFTTRNPYYRFTNLSANKIDYRWRITPYNQGNFDVQSSTIGRFKTGTTNSIQDISEIEYMEVIPNPSLANGSVNIYLENKNGFDGKLSVFNFQGLEIIKDKNIKFEIGSQILPIESSLIIPGIYFARIQNGKGIKTVKFVVQ